MLSLEMGIAGFRVRVKRPRAVHDKEKRQVVSGMEKKRIILLLATLAAAEAVYIAITFFPGKLSSRAEMTAIPGKSYSLLVDDERFPLVANPGEKIEISVFPSKLPPEALPPDRVVIRFLDDQREMARVRESRFRFYFDTPSALRPFFLSESLGALRGKRDWVTVSNVLKWTRRQFEPGKPGGYPPQAAPALLKELRSGHAKGFCAQYCYILVQALQALGYPARHVTLKGHEIAEAWVPEYGKWVALDPLNAAYFSGARGDKLSALEIAMGGSGTTVVSEIYHGRPENLFGCFSLLRYWLRNDLFSHPVNIYDLSKYSVRAVLSPEDLQTVRFGELFTVYPEELYSPPLQK